jgi:hypothetical protein
MDPISMIIAVVILMTGFVLGRLRRTSTAAKAVEAVCGCKHGLHMHADDGKCHEINLIPYSWDSRYGQANRWNEVACTCQKYVGPRPIEDYFATPSLPPSESSP